MLTIEDAIKELKDASDREVRYGDTNNHYYEIMMRIEAFDMAIKVLEQTMWIPVSERLPDKLEDVLIAFYDAQGEYDVAYMRKTFNETYKAQGSENEWVSHMGETTYADYEVSAWMPIEPYKAESEESE